MVPITWALVKELRTLYQAALAARANRLDAYLGKIFLPAPRKRALATAARRAEPRRLARLLSQAARLDAINKGAPRLSNGASKHARERASVNTMARQARKARSPVRPA